jgi:hypothetical protein
MTMLRIGLVMVLALLAGCASDGSQGSADVHMHGFYSTMFSGVSVH